MSKAHENLPLFLNYFLVCCITKEKLLSTIRDRQFTHHEESACTTLAEPKRDSWNLS